MEANGVTMIKCDLRNMDRKLPFGHFDLEDVSSSSLFSYLVNEFT